MKINRKNSSKQKIRILRWIFKFPLEMCTLVFLVVVCHERKSKRKFQNFNWKLKIPSEFKFSGKIFHSFFVLNGCKNLMSRLEKQPFELISDKKKPPRQSPTLLESRRVHKKERKRDELCLWSKHERFYIVKSLPKRTKIRFWNPSLSNNILLTDILSFFSSVSTKCFLLNRFLASINVDYMQGVIIYSLFSCLNIINVVKWFPFFASSPPPFSWPSPWADVAAYHDIIAGLFSVMK